MTNQSIALLIAVALLLLPYGLRAAEKQNSSVAKSAGVTRIELHPGSSVEIDAWGQCAIVSNALPDKTVLYIPVIYPEAWSAFIQAERSNISVSPCG